MDVSSPAGIAAAWSAMNGAATGQALQVAMVKQQQQADQSVVDLLQQAVDPESSVAPPGQGQHVDIRV